jgi:PIN domain nuclease of toxin-antitoxin system
MQVVLDASALLAFLRQEPGSELVDQVLGTAVLTSVNWAEVMQKSLSAGVNVDGLAPDQRVRHVAGGSRLPEPGAAPQSAGAHL